MKKIKHTFIIYIQYIVGPLYLIDLCTHIFFQISISGNTIYHPSAVMTFLLCRNSSVVCLEGQKSGRQMHSLINYRTKRNPKLKAGEHTRSLWRRWRQCVQTAAATVDNKDLSPGMREDAKGRGRYHYVNVKLPP